jgi:hypothetical protein
MSNVIILSLITLLTLFYLYLNKYYSNEIKNLFDTIGDIFDEIHGHIE